MAAILASAYDYDEPDDVPSAQQLNGAHTYLDYTEEFYEEEEEDQEFISHNNLSLSHSNDRSTSFGAPTESKHIETYNALYLQ